MPTIAAENRPTGDRLTKVHPMPAERHSRRHAERPTINDMPMTGPLVLDKHQVGHPLRPLPATHGATPQMHCSDHTHYTAVLRSRE